MNTLHRIGIVSFIALPLVGAGCNPFARVEERAGEAVAEHAIERAIENQTGGKVDVDFKGKDDKGSVTFRDEKTGAYTAMGDNVKIPDDFPSDVPRYPGAKTQAVSIGAGKKEAGLTQMTTDGVDKVLAWIEEELKKGGFARTATFDAGGTRMRSYEKGDVKISVTTGRDDEDKETSLILVRE